MGSGGTYTSAISNWRNNPEEQVKQNVERKSWTEVEY